jgi:hypothetical protein
LPETHCLVVFTLDCLQDPFGLRLQKALPHSEVIAVHSLLPPALQIIQSETNNLRRRATKVFSNQTMHKQAALVVFAMGTLHGERLGTAIG